MVVREAITEFFRSIKTAMIELFDKRQAVVTKAAPIATTVVIAAAGLQVWIVVSMGSRTRSWK